MNRFLFISILTISLSSFGQNPLYVPSAITSSTINLTLDEGTTDFYPGITTNTIGANGPILGPTIIMNTGDDVSIFVDNQLDDTTTIHWHGMRVAPRDDGGPYSKIPPNTTWNPQFPILDKAGTYWYHPHMHMQTNRQVSQGLSGLILVRDAEESSLNLPSTYGVDEFPLILQTKGFDAAGEILVHTDIDTSTIVNGTINTYVDFPSQVVRLRVLNGASQRTMELGFSDNRSFSLIGTDGGLLSTSVSMTRYRIAPGQRADILIDLTTSFGQNFQLMNFASEIPNGIYGGVQPGLLAGSTTSLPDYTSNPLNGNDHELLDINVITQTGSPVLTIPSSLAVFSPLLEGSADITRDLTFSTVGWEDGLGGPFLINGVEFDMGTINFNIPYNNIEIWSLTNETGIAHPFHIHAVQFFILDINGVPPPAELQGYNDVVEVPAEGNVRFITEFNDYYSDDIPYMYHCHMLTHEDFGMMGQFLVADPSGGIDDIQKFDWSIYPNPSNGNITISMDKQTEFKIMNASGRILRTLKADKTSTVDLKLNSGVYFISDLDGNTMRFMVH